MTDLKEYTIKVASKAEVLVPYQENGVDKSFVVVEIKDTEDKKYSIPKLKKDGSQSVAFEQIGKVSVGDTITVGVDEKPKKNKDGKEYTARTIRNIKGDEHGVPFTNQSAKPVPQASSFPVANQGNSDTGKTDQQKLAEMWSWYQSVKDNQMPF